jgi:hypothetical protein
MPLSSAAAWRDLGFPISAPADQSAPGRSIPPYAGLLNFKIWEEVEPPKGTVYNCPIRPWHNQQPSLTAAEAAPDIAVQIYNRAIHNQMLARIKPGPDDPAGDRLGAGRTGGFRAIGRIMGSNDQSGVAGAAATE